MLPHRNAHPSKRACGSDPGVQQQVRRANGSSGEHHPVSVDDEGSVVVAAGDSEDRVAVEQQARHLRAPPDGDLVGDGREVGLGHGDSSPMSHVGRDRADTVARRGCVEVVEVSVP